MKIVKCNNNIIHDIQHILFMFGHMYINFLKLDIKNGVDSWFWIRIHSMYKSKMIGYIKPPLWKRIKINITALFGLFFTVVILFLLTYGVYLNFKYFS